MKGNLVKLGVFTFLWLFFLVGIGSANQVSGSFVKKSGKEIVVQIEVGTPPPASVILKFKIPGGTDLVSATPAPQKIRPRKGVIKYLFNKISPGRHTVTMVLSEAVEPGQVRGEIRYRARGSETMLAVKIE